MKALLSYIDRLISQSRGVGPSSTKFLWLYAGWGIVSVAIVATLGGVAVYLFEATLTITAGPATMTLVSRGRADAVYWGAVAGLWLNGLGFVQWAKRHQTTATKEIILAGKGNQEVGAIPVLPEPAGKP
jgi:hypothetical protein